jgi:hypothetical protein
MTKVLGFKEREREIYLWEAQEIQNNVLARKTSFFFFLNVGTCCIKESFLQNKLHCNHSLHNYSPN